MPPSVPPFPSWRRSGEVQRPQDDDDRHHDEHRRGLDDQASLVANRLADLLLERLGQPRRGGLGQPRLGGSGRHVGIAIFPVFSVLSHFISAPRSSLTYDVNVQAHSSDP